MQPQCLSRAPAIAPCARDSRWHIRATLDWPPWLRGITSQHSPRCSRATKGLRRMSKGQGRHTRGKRNLGSDPWGGVPANPEPRARTSRGALRSRPATPRWPKQCYSHVPPAISNAGRDGRRFAQRERLLALCSSIVPALEGATLSLQRQN